MARPRKKIDEKLLEKLAFIHLPDQYIAHCLGISKDTLHRRYADKIEEFKANGKAKLKQLAWNKAQGGDWPAIKFLLQNYLKMTDKITHSVDEETSKAFTFNYQTKSMNQDDKD